MTITDLLAYLEDLPHVGYIEIDLDGVEIYVLARDMDCSATVDGALRLDGTMGYSVFNLKPSTMVIDCENIRYVRHIGDIVK